MNDREYEEHVVTGLTDAAIWTRDMGRSGTRKKRKGRKKKGGK